MSGSTDVYTLDEVAEEVGLPKSVLRFWEANFVQLRSAQTNRHPHYYHFDEIELLKGIKYFLYTEGYTMPELQRVLNEYGVRHVVTVGRGFVKERGDREEAGPAPMHVNNAINEGSDGYVSHSFEDGSSDWGAQTLVRNSAVYAEKSVASGDQQYQISDTISSGCPSTTVEDGTRSILSHDDIRKLQVVILELLECKRLLDCQL